MKHYYSEWDTHAAAWLRNLMAAGLIPPGNVDTRDVKEVTADELSGYDQCHFFAGIGGWAEALRLAGWPATDPVWTASLPCQPFSAAGRQEGEEDERHLWPAFRDLVAQCLPPVLFGEQVASRLGRDWLAGVRTDLEALGYRVGAADLCAASQGAPHIRQRIFWGAVRLPDAHLPGVRPRRPGPTAGAAAGVPGAAEQRERIRPDAGAVLRGESGRLPGTVRDGLEGLVGGGPAARPAERAGAGHWSRYDLLACRDGKTRRTEPGLFPLVDGVSFRLADGRTRKDCSRAKALRGIGNAIVPQVAAAFIRASVEAVRGT